jgi:hypothetical protein
MSVSAASSLGDDMEIVRLSKEALKGTSDFALENIIERRKCSK